MKMINKIKETGRELWIVLLLLAFCWSFYFSFNGIVTVNGEMEKINDLPIYYVETEKKQVSITFDSAWNIDDLDRILSILEKNEIKVTFFVTGDWVEKYPDAVKKIYESGHEIGNHGENHKNMSTLSSQECKNEIQEVHNRIYKLLGIEMNLFRPPSGDYDSEVIQVADEMGYYSIQWNVDSLDWKNYGVNEIVDKVVNHKNLKNGSIILLHNGTKYTADALQEVIDGLKNKGYEFVTVSELIYKENYTIDANGMQKKNDTAVSTE